MKIRTTTRIVTMSVCLSLLGGCASSMMQRSSAKINTPQNGDTATVVFMRTSLVAGAIGADIFEVNEGQLSYVGSVSHGDKIAHKTQPGKKVYMAYGTGADFMIADVEKGKTYFSIIRPNWGSGAMIPTPIRADGTTNYNIQSKDFKSWMKGTDLLVKKAEAQAWFEKNKAKFNKVYKSYWNKFKTKNDTQKQQRTLRPQDGINCVKKAEICQTFGIEG
jgi:hypothetical protein